MQRYTIISERLHNYPGFFTHAFTHAFTFHPRFHSIEFFLSESFVFGICLKLISICMEEEKPKMKRKKKETSGERKPNWKEYMATVEDIQNFLMDRILLRHNVITGRVEYRLPSPSGQGAGRVHQRGTGLADGGRRHHAETQQCAVGASLHGTGFRAQDVQERARLHRRASVARGNEVAAQRDGTGGFGPHPCPSPRRGGDWGGGKYRYR